jgi:hypothetical protein
MNTSRLGLAALGAGALAAIALAGDCFVNVQVDCCALAAYVPFCANCTHHPNCCDLLTSDEVVTHHVPAGSGQAGKTKTETGASCRCKVQQRSCSQAGYCVDIGDPFEISITPRQIDDDSDPCVGEI